MYAHITFQCEIYEIALPIIILANYAANAFFHAMEMQDPVRISCADVPVVEKNGQSSLRS